MKTSVKIRCIKVGDSILLAWPVIAPLFTWVIGANFYLGLFIFFIVPSIYLSFKKVRAIKKAFLFSVTLLPVAIIIDYLMESTGGWHTFSVTESWRILGYVSIENFIWAFWFVYFMVMFYEVFIEHHIKNTVYEKKIRLLVLIVFMVSMLFLLIFIFSPHLLDINQVYLKIGLLALVPPILFIPIRARKSAYKLIKTGVYFSALFFWV
jgi:hypothetical protein